MNTDIASAVLSRAAVSLALVPVGGRKRSQQPALLIHAVSCANEQGA